jgi:hypothetical protein
MEGIVFFENIRKAIRKQHDSVLSSRIKNLKESVTSVNINELSWSDKQQLTEADKRNGFADVESLKKRLIDRHTKSVEKSYSEAVRRLYTVECAEIPNEAMITINVEWKKSRTWGSNPTAKAYIPNIGQVTSGSIGGCGYDKGSTAVANVLDQATWLIKLMCIEKNKKKNIGKKNHEIFGYGSGYGIIPSFEGGVGVSCYPRIFESIGMDFETVAWGDNFDAYRITKNKKN